MTCIKISQTYYYSSISSRVLSTKVYTSLSPKQQEGRSNSKDFEEDTQSSMDRAIFEQVCAMPSPHTVP